MSEKKIIVVCTECGADVELDLNKVKCKKCLDIQARELLRRKLGRNKIDPSQLKKALGID